MVWCVCVALAAEVSLYDDPEPEEQTSSCPGLRLKFNFLLLKTNTLELNVLQASVLSVACPATFRLCDPTESLLLSLSSTCFAYARCKCDPWALPTEMTKQYSYAVPELSKEPVSRAQPGPGCPKGVLLWEQKELHNRV